ncbi:MAG: hypothetical protein ACYTBZ_14330 [Planctomycetota bacterium]
MIEDEIRTKIYLSDEQVSQLSKNLSQRAMRTGHAHGKQLQQFMESLIEYEMTNEEFTQETAKEFAEITKPALPALREFMIGYGKDVRSVLTPKQYAKWKHNHREMLNGVDQFANKMNRWAEGRVKKGEDIDRTEPEDKVNTESKTENNPQPEKKKQKQVYRSLRDARNSADRLLRSMGPEKWRSLLEANKIFFKFSQEQSAQAETILTEYTKKAQKVMTSEWKQQIRQNRIKYLLGAELKNISLAPWDYHLQQKYLELIKPIEELGKTFEQDILALVTNQQYKTIKAKLQEFAEKHGMNFTKPDIELLGLLPQQQSEQ